MKLKITLFTICFVAAGWVFGQSESLPYKVLLEDKVVLLESSEAIYEMYNFNFASAEKQFKWLTQKYPNHPLSYFLLGLSEWWKIVPNIDNQAYDQQMEHYMDLTISKAEKLLEKHPDNEEAVFFLAAAHGFLGRLYSERRQWRKASFAGKAAFNYMQMNRGIDTLSLEFKFGDALYNYFHPWIKENYPMLRPVLAMFPSGNKQKGIKLLEEVARNAFYTRTEALYFLLHVYSSYEKGKRPLAREVAIMLHQTYPNNPYFHRMYAKEMFLSNNIALTRKTSELILARLKNNQTGYEENTGRYASYFLGYIAQRYQKDTAKARNYYEQSIAYAEKAGSQEAGYTLHSIEALAKMAHNNNQINRAVSYYKRLKSLSARDDGWYERAKKYLKENDPNPGIFGWF